MTQSNAMTVSLLDLEPAAQDDEQEILAGLEKSPREISPKYFYDEAGSKLFDEICELPEYYPTRTELGIMRQNITEISQLIGPHASIIEFGSGSSLKTRLLLEDLEEPAAYVPVDISREHLEATAAQLAREFDDIEVLPICADFMQPFDLPSPRRMPERNVIYFPGSTIGNFSTSQATALLRVMRAQAKDNGALLIGVDLEKSKDILEPAYDDAAGVTAAFNLNLLTRLNREYGGNFDKDQFTHRAIYDEQHRRIEMRLVSQKEQVVMLAGKRFEIGEGEYIVTEHSHKYSIERFATMAAKAGFEQCACWTDPDKLFGVLFLQAA